MESRETNYKSVKQPRTLHDRKREFKLGGKGKKEMLHLKGM